MPSQRYVTELTDPCLSLGNPDLLPWDDLRIEQYRSSSTYYMKQSGQLNLDIALPAEPAHRHKTSRAKQKHTQRSDRALCAFLCQTMHLLCLARYVLVSRFGRQCDESGAMLIRTGYDPKRN